MIEIRTARREDLPELRRVAIETQMDTFAAFNTPENMEAFIRDVYSPERFEQELDEKDSICYLAWEGDELAGFARLRVTDEAAAHLGNNSIELQRIYVSTKFQGQQVGKQLMLKSLEYARNGKFDWIWLGVWERNFKAQAIYAKWGFERFSEHTFWMGSDPQTDWLLRLRC